MLSPIVNDLCRKREASLECKTIPQHFFYIRYKNQCFLNLFSTISNDIGEETDPTDEAQCCGTVTPHKRLPAVPSVAWGTDLKSASSCPLPPGS